MTRPRERCPATLWTADRAAAADHAAIERGLASNVLMERASLAVAHEVRARASGDAPVWVLAGPGNNGGDGFATARILRGWGFASHVVTVGRASEATRRQEELARHCGVVVHETPPEPPAEAVVVDALLGTGARGPVRDTLAALLRWQTSIRGLRVAIDVPTGVDVDTGEVATAAFRADVTVTFVRSKPGLHVTPGREHAGTVVVADIGIDATPVQADDDALRLIDPACVAARVQALPQGRHKGDRGHVMVLAGGRDTPGAAVLVATAAMRCGAGLCTVVGERDDVGALVVRVRPEIMLSEGRGEDPFARADALVVGPGLTDPGAWTRLPALYVDDPRPAVWDASALDHVPFGAHPKGPRILTPHPGEAARLLARLGSPVESVQASRLRVVQTLAAATGAVVLLKGAGTLIGAPSGAVQVVTVGSPALATAGSGDALAGLLGALLARGIPVEDAAAIGAHVHGVAGDVAAERHPSPLAGDILEAMAEVLADRAGWGASAWPAWRWS